MGWWLAILWRHLSKVTRNYDDYVRAQRVSGVAFGGYVGVAGSQSDSMLRAWPCFSFSSLGMRYTQAKVYALLWKLTKNK